VDLDTGAVVAVTLTGGTKHDTKTLEDTLVEADANIQKVRNDSDDKTTKRMAIQIAEVVADKGYHSNDVLTALEAMEVRSYISEPARGRRNWKASRT